MLLSKLTPHAGHLLLIRRGDAKVLILGTSRAGDRLTAINAASPLEHEVIAVPTEHYRAIERELCTRFNCYADDGYGHWVHAELEDVQKALEEYDFATGARKFSGNLELGQRAYVRGIGFGEVSGFLVSSRGHGLGPVERVVFFTEDQGTLHVPRSHVKPCVRVGA